MKQKTMIICITYLIFCLLFLTGCKNDMGEIEKQNFATAIGVDYRDGEYDIYIQMVGLDAVAKSEDGGTMKADIYVSKTTGKTFIDGFFKAYYTTQERFLWANVTTIILSEDLLKKGLGSVFDGLTRYYEFRSTPWIFATKEPIDEILSSTGFFNQSTLNTILHNPENIFEQSSTIKPVKLNQFAREFFEPARTVSIPSLMIDKTQWKKNKKKEAKPAINGAFFLNNHKYQGYFPYEKIKGLRWVTKETIRASILLPNEKKPEFLIVLEDQNVKIKAKKRYGKFRFKVVYSANGIVSNRMGNYTTNVGVMEDYIKKGVISQVRQLYELGLEHDIDFLNLKHKIYQKYPKDWKKMNGDNKILTKDSLDSIEVHVLLEHSGSFKNRKIIIRD